MQDWRVEMSHDYRILKIDASARGAASATRALTAAITDRLSAARGGADVESVDLAAVHPPLLTERMVEAYFTPPEDRSADQRAAVGASDRYVAQLQAADAVVIGAPIYNFTVPGALKAWFDQVGRAGVTFRYTANGPEGLLRNKTVYVAVASGGTPIGSEIDFATPYIRHFFGFLGLTDVRIVRDPADIDVAPVAQAA